MIRDYIHCTYISKHIVHILSWESMVQSKTMINIKLKLTLIGSSENSSSSGEKFDIYSSASISSTVSSTTSVCELDVAAERLHSHTQHNSYTALPNNLTSCSQISWVRK